jgi:hypothetical protein
VQEEIEAAQQERDQTIEEAKKAQDEGLDNNN